MAKIIRNYVLEVLKPVDTKNFQEIRSIKQDHEEMKIFPNDIMRLEIGLGLIPLVDKNSKDNLFEGVSRMRENIKKDIGITIPSIHILDNVRDLTQFEYSFFIRGKEMVKYEIKHNKYLCLDNGEIKKKIEGKNVKDPVFGIPAILINKNQIDEAAEAGYLVAGAQCIIMTNLQHLIKENISEIFTYNDSKNILETVREKHQALVDACFLIFKPIEIKKILGMVLEKRKNLLNIDKILELLLYYSEEKNKEKIVELIIKKL